MKTCPACQRAYPDDAESCPRDGSRLVAESRDERECPYCTERILRKARVCKHCGREVEPLVPAQAPPPAPPAVPPQRIAEPQSERPQTGEPATATSGPLAVSASFARRETEKLLREMLDAELLAAARRLSEYNEESQGMIRAELRRRGLDEHLTPQPQVRRTVPMAS
jgi:DNA-directed RNA polymerase subunit RPC12/RpoP